MTDQIDYSSVAWAKHVSRSVGNVVEHLRQATSILRSLAEDLDADGNDMHRGPHASTIEDIEGGLRLALLASIMEENKWRSILHAREIMK